MNVNKLSEVSPTGGEAAVGADSSRPPPIYRPPRDYQIHLLNPIIAPTADLSAPRDGWSILLNPIIGATAQWSELALSRSCVLSLVEPATI